MTNNNLVSQIVDSDGLRVRYTWCPGESSENFRPWRQAYGIIFNKENEVLVIQEDGKWHIPGGTPEDDETPEQTLNRELLEEADITIKNSEFIGAQKVEFMDYGNPNQAEGDRFYQLRFIADLDELREQTPDPDGGSIHPRKFVQFEELSELMNWGKTGKAMFDESLRRHLKK